MLAHYPQAVETQLALKTPVCSLSLMNIKKIDFLAFDGFVTSDTV